MPWRLVVVTTGVLEFACIQIRKVSECKRAIIRLHCATSKCSLWNMEYVARGGAFERPRIYRTSTFMLVLSCVLANMLGCYNTRLFNTTVQDFIFRCTCVFSLGGGGC